MDVRADGAAAGAAGAREQDREHLWRRWKASGDRGDFESTLESLRPLVESEVSRFKTVSAPPSALRAEGFRLTAQALRTFDPGKDAQLSTWVGRHLRKMSRYAQRFQSAGSIPEARRLRIATYQRVRDELSEKHGREPSAQELADVLAWPLSEVARMRRELRGEILDTADPVLQELGRDEGPDVDMAMRYVYPELEQPEKLVFEYTFGYAGQPALGSNAEIARRLKVSETTVRNTKRRIGAKIMPFLAH